MGLDGLENRRSQYSPKNVFATVDNFIRDVPSGGVIGPLQSLSTDSYPLILTAAYNHSGSTPGKVKAYPLSTTTITNGLGDNAVYFDDIFTEEMERQYPFLLEIKN